MVARLAYGVVLAVALGTAAGAQGIDLAQFNLQDENSCEVLDHRGLFFNRRIVSLENVEPKWSHNLFRSNMTTLLSTLLTLGAEVVPIYEVTDANLAEADLLFVGGQPEPLSSQEIAAAKRFVNRGHSILALADSWTDAPFETGYALTRAFGAGEVRLGDTVGSLVRSVAYHPAMDNRFGHVGEIGSTHVQGFRLHHAGFNVLMRAKELGGPPSLVTLQYYDCVDTGLAPTAGRLAFLADANVLEDWHYINLHGGSAIRNTQAIRKGDNMRLVLGTILYLLDRDERPCNFVEGSVGLEPGDLLNLQFPESSTDDFAQTGVASFDFLAHDSSVPFLKQVQEPIHMQSPIVQHTKYRVASSISDVTLPEDDLSITVLFDGSETLLASDPANLRICAASMFFEGLPSDKDVATLEFDFPSEQFEHIDVLQTFTSSTSSLVSSVQGLRASSFDTPIVPAVKETLDFMEQHRGSWPGKRVLVIAADGQKDNDNTSLDGQIARAKALGIPTIVIGAALARGPLEAFPELYKMSVETGGFFVPFSNPIAFEPVFECLAGFFHSRRHRVTMTFDPIPPPGTVLQIPFETNRGKIVHTFETPGAPTPLVFDDVDPGALRGLQVGVLGCGFTHEATDVMLRSRRSFVSLLASYGARVKEVKSVVDGTLEGFNVLVTGLHNGSFSAEELGVIQTWVEGGGGLIVFSDQQPFAQDQNGITSLFGVETVAGHFGNGTVKTNREGLISEGPFGNYLDATVSGYHPLGQGAFALDDEAPGVTVHARTSHGAHPAIVAIDGFDAIGEFAGNIAMFNDVDFIDDGAIHLGMNAALVLNAFAFLTSGFPRVTVEQHPLQFEPGRELPIRFIVEFNLPVTGFGEETPEAPDVEFTGTATGLKYEIVDMGNGRTFEIRVIDAATDGTVVPTIPAGAAVGAFGKTNLGSTSMDNEVLLDRFEPKAIIRQSESQADPTMTLPVRFDISFTEPVTKFDELDIAFTGSSMVRAFELIAEGDGFLLNVLDATNGVITPVTARHGFVDAAGRTGFDYVEGYDQSVSFTSPPPQLDITRGPGQPEYDSTLPIAFRIVSNEELASFSVAAIDFLGTASQVLATLSGGPREFDLIVTSALPGTLIPALPAGAVSDLAGSGNEATVGQRAVFDTTPPIVSASVPSSAKTGTDPVEYVVMYSGASEITLSSTDVTVRATGTATGSVSVLGSGAERRTVRISDISGAGTLSIALPGGTARDAAGLLATSLPSTEPFEVLPPRLRTHVSSLNFGRVGVGAFSDRQVSVENLGGDTLRGSSSVPPPFSIVTGESYALNEGESTLVVVRFRPMGEGDYSSALTLTGGGGAEILLTASGGAVQTLTDYVLPSTHDFGYATVGAPLSVRLLIVNDGEVPLEGEALSNGPFRVVSGTPYSVPMGAMSFLDVAFAPEEEGDFAGTIDFTGADGARVLVRGKARESLGTVRLRVIDAVTDIPLSCAVAVVSSDTHVETANVDLHGIAETRPLPLGTYSLRVDAPGYGRMRDEVSVDNGGVVTRVVYLSPSDDSLIEGRVVVDGGTMVSGARVEALQDGAVVVDTYSCAEGLFALPWDGSLAGIEIRISAAGYAVERVPVPGDGAGLEIALRLDSMMTSNLIGRVTDGISSDPLSESRVTARAGGIEVVQYTGEDGSYRLGNLGGGEYRIAVSRLGYRGDESEVMLYGIGEETAIDFSLEPIETGGEGEGEGESPGCAAGGQWEGSPAPVGDVVLFGVCALVLGWILGGSGGRRAR